MLTTDGESLELLLGRACASGTEAGPAIARLIQRRCRPADVAELERELSKMLPQVRVRGARVRACTPRAELARQDTLTVGAARVQTSKERAYFDTPIFATVCNRFPWLFALMLFQSVSGSVVESYEALIRQVSAPPTCPRRLLRFRHWHP